MFLSTTNDNTSDISFSDPENSDDVLYCEILNGSEPLYVQTPKLIFKISDDKKSMNILFKNLKSNSDELVTPFYTLIKNIESSICSKISESSKNWFSQEINKNTIEENLYKSVILLPKILGNPLGMKVKLPYNTKNEEEFEVYNKTQKKLDLSYLEKNNNLECTFLLLAKELIISSTQAQVEWEMVQVLTHKKKKKIKGFGIRHDKNNVENLKPSIKVERKIRKEEEDKTDTKSVVSEKTVDIDPIEEKSNIKVNLIN